MTILFESSRLTYSKVTLDDFSFFAEVYMNELVMQYSYKDAFDTQDQARKEFEKIISSNEDGLYIAKIL